MISDSLEETVRFGIVNGVKKKNNKRTKRFNDGLLIEDIYYNYQDSIYKESWRYVYEYDSLDRISKQEFYKESKVNNVEKFLYNSDGDILEHDNINFDNGIEKSRYLTLYEYDAAGNEIKQTLQTYFEGEFSIESCSGFEYDDRGALIREYRPNSNSYYYYSGCSTELLDPKLPEDKKIDTSTVIKNFDIEIDNSNLIEEVKVYPNPVSGNLNIDFGNKNLFDYYIIYDIYGKMVSRKTINSRIEIINTQEFSGEGTFIISTFKNGRKMQDKLFTKI